MVTPGGEHVPLEHVLQNWALAGLNIPSIIKLIAIVVADLNLLMFFLSNRTWKLLLKLSNKELLRFF